MKQINYYLFLLALLMSATFQGKAEGTRPATVIITAGQSNADGRVPNGLLPQHVKANGYQYCQWSYGSGEYSGKGEFKPFYPWIHGMSNHDSWGFDAIVYYRIEQLLKERFYVIKESLGGTSIDTLCKSRKQMHWCADAAWLSRNRAADKGGKSLLKALTENIGACIDKQLSTLPQGYDIKVMLWHQGESDIAQAARYHDNLHDVVAYVRNYLVKKTGKHEYAHLPVVCGTYAKKGRGYDKQVVDALYRLAKEDANFHVVDVSDATLLSDNIHFDAKGAELLGNRVFDVLADKSIITRPEEFCWYDGGTHVSYTISKNVSPVVATAMQMWGEDMKDVTGATLRKEGAGAKVRIVQMDKDKGATKWLKSAGIDVARLSRLKDAFQIKTHNGQLIVAGSDGRGTAYGILELSRMAGVSPWKWWADVKPEKRQRLTVAADLNTLQSPSVEFRGIFRDVTLMAVPKVHLSDLTITTRNSGEVSVDTKVANSDKNTTVSHVILDAKGKKVGTDKVENPNLWTAETPYLYTLLTTLSRKGKTLQTFEHKFGFRELTIEGYVIKLNGQPIKLRGVTCHSTDPKTAKVVSEELTLRGIVLTCNAAVAGEGPKFARTAFPVIAKKTGTVSGDFYLYRIDKTKTSQLLRMLFDAPQQVAPPFHPFETQYDTYLMRFEDICGE